MFPWLFFDSESGSRVSISCRFRIYPKNNFWSRFTNLWFYFLWFMKFSKKIIFGWDYLENYFRNMWLFLHQSTRLDLSYHIIPIMTHLGPHFHYGTISPKTHKKRQFFSVFWPFDLEDDHGSGLTNILFCSVSSQLSKTVFKKILACSCKKL